jgi:protein transport protein SEC61 subunit gamma and related proteins
MADGLEKITDIPTEFIKEGTTFINRCTKPDQKGEWMSL